MLWGEGKYREVEQGEEGRGQREALGKKSNEQNMKKVARGYWYCLKKTGDSSILYQGRCLSSESPAAFLSSVCHNIFIAFGEIMYASMRAWGTHKPRTCDPSCTKGICFPRTLTLGCRQVGHGKCPLCVQSRDMALFDGEAVIATLYPFSSSDPMLLQLGFLSFLLILW